MSHNLGDPKTTAIVYGGRHTTVSRLVFWSRLSIVGGFAGLGAAAVEIARLVS